MARPVKTPPDERRKRASPPLKAVRALVKTSALADFELQTKNYKKERVTNAEKDAPPAGPFKIGESFFGVSLIPIRQMRPLVLRTFSADAMPVRDTGSYGALRVGLQIRFSRYFESPPASRAFGGWCPESGSNREIPRAKTGPCQSWCQPDTPENSIRWYKHPIRVTKRFEGISFYRESKKARWCVRISGRLTPSGKEQKKRLPDSDFATQATEAATPSQLAYAAAKQWAAQQERRKREQGEVAFTLTPGQNLDAIAALKLLDGRASLVEAASELLRQRFPRGDKQLIGAAVQSYLEELTKLGRSPVYVAGLDDPLWALARMALS